MIKTLQISSILAVIVACVLFVSSIVFGTHEDKQIEAFLKSPGAKEQFLKGGHIPTRPSGEKSSPLVDEAERFARILNPPPPPKPVIKPEEIVKIEEPKPPVDQVLTAKYKLYGTVVCESNPEMSLAMLDEPGKGLLFVRQGSEIMRTTIEQVLDGKIIIKDSRGTIEMTVEEGPAPVSVASGPPQAAGIPPVGPSTSISSDRITAPSGAARPGMPPSTSGSGRRGPVTPESIRSRMTSAENARLSALSDRLKAAKEARDDSGKTAAQIEAEEDAKAQAIFKKLAESARDDAAESNDPTGRRPPVPPSRAR